jgi:AcrR family transcriptional regulator
MATETKRRRLRPEERRELIVAAAVEEFGRRGHRDARLSDIARAAGTTKAVIYDHFPNKNALHAEVLSRTSQELIATVAAAIDIDADAQERLRASFAAYFEFVAGHPAARQLLFRDPTTAGDVARAQGREQRIAADAVAAMLMSERGFLAGRPHRRERATLVAQAVIGALNAIAAGGRDLSPERMTEVAMDVLYPGLEALRR